MHITICTYVRVSTHKATLNASITHTFTLGNAHFNTQASRLVTYSLIHGSWPTYECVMSHSPIDVGPGDTHTHPTLIITRVLSL